MPKIANEVSENPTDNRLPVELLTRQRTVTPIISNASPFKIPFDRPSKSGQQSYSAFGGSPEVSQEPGMIPMEIYVRRQDCLRQSKSMPGLAHHLSHKLSSTFGNPTVVHRPTQRSRPSILSLRETSSPNTSLTHEVSHIVYTSPSSLNSRSVSLDGRSTPKTSLESNIAYLRTAKTKDAPEKAGSQIGGDHSVAGQVVPETPLTSIQETPVVVNPTIVTVETTANAKIFFETHFNSILSGQATPRSLRRHELEVRLQYEDLSPEERRRERLIWADQETEYLRQSRVLKGKSNHMTGSKGVSVAGYEVIRILGKGSFGVVRLVREKSESNKKILSNDNEGAQSPVSNVSPGIAARNGLKFTRASRRTSRRIPLTTVKGNVYAMKVIRKSDMLRNSQEGHLRAERDFLVASEKSRWVVPLVASFQDTTNLYLVMEYMIGGDFLGLLIRLIQLKEKRAKWYIAEMVLCVEEAHRLRWIHRDVKPDNFLISASGHLKISDFGLAFDGHWAHDQTYFNNHRYSLLEKLGIKIEGDLQDRAESAQEIASKKLAKILTGARERTGRERHEKPPVEEPGEQERILQWRNRHGKRNLAHSVVGTSQYMAPEVIRGELYDGRCDWWSLGIILFEVTRPLARPSSLYF